MSTLVGTARVAVAGSRAVASSSSRQVGTNLLPQLSLLCTAVSVSIQRKAAC